MGRRALNFDIDDDIDLDWKPEPLELELEEPSEEDPLETEQEPTPPNNQTDSLLSLLSGGISRPAYNTSKTPYRGALTIIEYDFNPRMIETILDKDKVMIRFPFGGIKLTDGDTSNGSKRETREEVGLSLGKLTQRNFVGGLSGGPNCTLYIFAKTLSAKLRHKVILGEEQRDHASMLMTTVDRNVDLGLFSRNHANAWRLFQRWKVGKTY